MDLNRQKILITGTTGRLGSQLAHDLTEMGLKPIAHCRESSDTSFIESLGLEKRTADLRIRPELAALVQGVDAVIHTAAWVSFRRDKLTQFTGINTIGAVDLYNAARKAGVKRFVHVSTVGAVGARAQAAPDSAPSNGRISESWEFNLGHLRVPYILSKRAAEEELLKLAAEGGPELVIVNPSIILAPSHEGNDRETAIKAFRMPLVPDYDNLVNMVDVRDVSRGTLGALCKGEAGDRYILGGDDISIRELMLSLSDLLGKLPHLVKFPRWMLGAAGRFKMRLGNIDGVGGLRAYPDLVKFADYDWSFSSQKAITHLGYRPRSIHT
ncbi:MAG: NAD-dependent epimerase/dehydratase family protein, partial [bacterium]|nr:NAD-dependent epimerase/dehydratase family protein [bacterium]